MKRLPYRILLISMLFALLLGACGPEPTPNGSAQDGGLSAQPGASPSVAFVAVSPTAGPTELPDRTDRNRHCKNTCPHSGPCGINPN